MSKPINGIMTSPFGWRTSPIKGSRELHDGVDIAAPQGTDIYAPDDGVITHRYYSDGYGNETCEKVVNTSFPNPAILVCFGHQSVLGPPVGTQIKRGDIIGKVGSTGLSTGPHTHIRVKPLSNAAYVPANPNDISSVNPIPYFASLG